MPSALAAMVIAGSAPIATAMTALDDEALEAQRGGYIAAGGFVFDFGAQVKTLVDGRLALQSSLDWTGAGAVTQQAFGTAQGFAGSGLAVDRRPDGVVLSDASGSTTIIHTLADNRIANVVLNTASNRDVRQETSLTLTLPGFGAVQQGLALDLFGLRLNRDAAGAARLGLGR